MLLGRGYKKNSHTNQINQKKYLPFLCGVVYFSYL